jgi:hypothetical protein
MGKDARASATEASDANVKSQTIASLGDINLDIFAATVAANLAGAPVLPSRMEISSDWCRSRRCAYKARFTHVLSVRQSEIDHPIAVYLNLAFSAKVLLCFGHCECHLTRGSERCQRHSTFNGSEFCGNRVDCHMSGNASQLNRSVQHHLINRSANTSL